MSGGSDAAVLVATVLAYVPTEDGVKQVEEGQPMPANALEEDAERLIEAGVFVRAGKDRSAGGGKS